MPTIRGPSSGRRAAGSDSSSLDNSSSGSSQDVDSMNHNNRIPSQVITQVSDGGRGVPEAGSDLTGRSAAW